MFVPFFAAWRRAMRRHQDVPSGRAGRLPMWRLIGGEVLWAVQQLVQRPWVLLGLLGGFVATLAVLGAAAPGPILEAPWSSMVAIAAGLLVAAGVRGIDYLRGSEPDRSDGQGPRPLLAAAELSGAATICVLIVWLAVWLVQGIT